MAEGYNKWMGLGNLGADPELKMTQGGQAVLKLRMACTETYLDKNQTRQERTEWVSVSLWGKRGEALAKFLVKGDRIFVEGSIRTSSYEKDGQKRYSTEINATNVILNGKGGGQHSNNGEDRRPAADDAPKDDTGLGDYSAGNGTGEDEIPF